MSCSTALRRDLVSLSAVVLVRVHTNAQIHMHIKNIAAHLLEVMA